MAVDRELYFRGRVLRIVVVGLFLILITNLFGMMVLRHDYFKEQALENRQVRFRVRAPRGRIIDRDGIILADNMYIADITLPRSSLTDAGCDSTLDRLIRWFDLPQERTVERLRSQKERSRGRLTLVHNAGMPRISAIEERGSQLPGVRVEARSRRRYHFGSLLAHVIGYVGEVSSADLDTSGSVAGYRVADVIGKQGIELAFEDTLRGGNGVKLEEINASGRIVGRQAVWLQEVEPGQDVVLSISVPLQNRMAEIIGDRVACGVALSTVTGEVLAAYSNPVFDPNMMTTSISSEDWNTLINDPAKPFFNRIVQATYPPGSLYKPVTSLAGLHKGVIKTDSSLEPCLGGLDFGNRFFRCWKRGGHGEVNHADALVHSCDTFFYQLVQRLEIDEMAAAARAFGLGSKCTTIFPEESSGNIPDAAWYDRRFGRNGWTRGVLLNNAIGQGEVLTTPLQMALFMARIASSGRVPDPVFVLAPEMEPRKPVKPLPFAESDMAWIRKTLFEVVDRGTGKGAAIEGIPIAGKTGTAQNSGEDHAWFMCFAPADNPQVAMAIIVENAGNGSTEAAPLAGQWLETYFGVSEADLLDQEEVR